MKARGQGEINNFAARVDILLGARGETRSDLARALGMTPQALRDILLRGEPRMSTIVKVAAALGVLPQELLRPVSEREFATLMPRK
jgi:transcriptional regulator with XRE-family HTH domain